MYFWVQEAGTKKLHRKLLSRIIEYLTSWRMRLSDTGVGMKSCEEVKDGPAERGHCPSAGPSGGARIAVSSAPSSRSADPAEHGALGLLLERASQDEGSNVSSNRVSWSFFWTGFGVRADPQSHLWPAGPLSCLAVTQRACG